MTDSKPSSGAHDSGQTSDSARSGEGGSHSADRDPSSADGWPAGSRLDRPHHEQGWESSR